MLGHIQTVRNEAWSDTLQAVSLARLLGSVPCPFYHFWGMLHVEIYSYQHRCSGICHDLVYACLDICCSHFLTIVAGVDLHFRHESELPELPVY